MHQVKTPPVPTLFGDNFMRYKYRREAIYRRRGGGGYHRAAHHLHECLPPTTRPAAGADVARSVCTRSAETRALAGELLLRAADSNSTLHTDCTRQFRSGADHVQSRSLLIVFRSRTSSLPTRIGRASSNKLSFRSSSSRVS